MMGIPLDPRASHTGHTEADGSPTPAGRDLPREIHEASWWPFVAASGAAVLYLGVGLAAVSHGESGPIDLTIAAAIGTVGFLVLVGALGGWTYQGFVARYWKREVGDWTRYYWGVVGFLATEAATFGAVFTYYGFIRAGPWPPGPLPPLVSGLVVVNTLVLLTSSVTLHLAGDALGADRRRAFLGYLGLTLLLGIGFLLGQLEEYATLISREGFTLTSGIYASAFYGLTGLHGLHVTFGVVLLGVLLARAVAGQYGPDRNASLRTATYYWHFVDAVWLVLVLTLYVGATFPKGF